MEVKQLFVTSIDIAYLGETPFIRLLHSEKLSALAKALGFHESVEVQQQDSRSLKVRFQNGLLDLGDKGEYAIPRLEIEPRKIVMEFTGASAYAREAYVALVEALENLVDADRNELLNPIFHTEETIVVSHLRFPVEKLFVETLARVVDAAVSEVGSTNYSAHVWPKAVTFEVDYLPTDRTLSEARVGLTRKNLVIGPKAGIPAVDQIYESRAPLDTNAHIAFLEQLEAELMTQAGE